jgi:hypothetical protein
MSAILRRIGLFLVLLANRIEQRSRLTLALEPLAGTTSVEEQLDEIRYRNARYY